MLRCYTDLIQLKTIEERFEYLKLNGVVGEELFGYARYLNQEFYHGHVRINGKTWYDVRDEIVIRDGGYDLGVKDWPIKGNIYVHHMNPVTLEQLKNNDPELVDPENLISCSYNTHQAITYGNELLLPQPIVVRRPGDTCPWKT